MSGKFENIPKNSWKKDVEYFLQNLSNTYANFKRVNLMEI